MSSWTYVTTEGSSRRRKQTLQQLNNITQSTKSEQK